MRDFRPSTSHDESMIRLPSHRARSQQGVALLTILLLVVSITVVAGAMLASQKVAIRKSSLLFEQDQLFQGIQAGQQLAVALIQADSKLNDSDSLQDVWAQPIPPYSSESYTIKIEIQDEASRFNINNLYHDGAVDEAAFAVFKRLLSNLGLEETLATAVLDWQDPDISVYQDSADEATVYQSLSQEDGRAGGRAKIANQPFLSVAQLIDVPGMTAETVKKLEAYITAVPYYLPVNVNTASAPVLSALIAGEGGSQMQAFTAARDSQVIDSMDTLWQTPPFATLNEEDRSAMTPLIAVDSQAFSALIVASEAGVDANVAKQRFATVMISKLDKGSEANSANNTAVNNNEANRANQQKDAKIIRAYSQRLWPYRPSI